MSQRASSATRQSRRLQHQEPEVEGTPPGERVTPPRQPSLEVAAGVRFQTPARGGSASSTDFATAHDLDAELEQAALGEAEDEVLVEAAGGGDQRPESAGSSWSLASGASALLGRVLGPGPSRPRSPEEPLLPRVASSGSRSSSAGSLEDEGEGDEGDNQHNHTNDTVVMATEREAAARAAAADLQAQQNAQRQADALDREERLRLRSRARRQMEIHRDKTRRWTHQAVTMCTAVSALIDEETRHPGGSPARTAQINEGAGDISKYLERIREHKLLWEGAIAEGEYTDAETTAFYAEVETLNGSLQRDALGEWGKIQNFLQQNGNIPPASPLAPTGAAAAAAAAPAAQAAPRAAPGLDKFFKLPQIVLPKFGGTKDETRYQEFKTAFTGLIDRTPLEDHQRLYHLRTVLVGEAHTAVAHLGSEDPQYKEAWAILDDRYGNKAAQRARLDHELLTFKPMDNKSAAGLKRLHDTLLSKYNLLRKLDHTVDASGTYRALLPSKYPSELIRRITAQKGIEVEEMPMLDFFRAADFFITADMRMESKKHKRESSETGKREPPNKRTPNKSQSTTHNFAVKEASELLEQMGLVALAATSRKGKAPDPKRRTNDSDQTRKCHLCEKTGHYIVKCPQYVKQSTKDRNATVQRLQLCFKCLRKGHGVKSCSNARPCNYKLKDGSPCKKMHHYTLHPQAETAKKANKTKGRGKAGGGRNSSA